LTQFGSGVPREVQAAANKILDDWYESLTPGEQMAVELVIKVHTMNGEDFPFLHLIPLGFPAEKLIAMVREKGYGPGRTW
jgi:hypothetical protein